LPLRQRVSVEIVTAAQARYTLEKFHYLHRARVGRQINYAVFVDGVVDGVITFAYPMMSAPLFDVPADELVEFARMFLYQNIPHTATCAIGKVLKRVKADWMRLFPDSKEPRLVVSWSDTVFHKGTIYKAANFTWLRRTKGDNRKAAQNSATSKRGFRKHTNDYAHEKDCWLYALNNADRKRLEAIPASPWTPQPGDVEIVDQL
jgi:hypothetical protein